MSNYIVVRHVADPRLQLVDGLHAWFKIPDAELAIIREIVHSVDQTTLLSDILF